MLAILLLASVLPLALGILSLQFFGSRYYRENQGLLFQNTASYLANALSINTRTNIEKLSDWAALSPLPDLARSTPRLTFEPNAEAIERMWPELEASDPRLRPILENELAAELRRFRTLNPLYREVLVTDASGVVVAATNKTSDYIQSDEEWWQKARNLPPRATWLQGITYDQSAKIHSLDVALALRDSRTGALVGVVKGVFNVSSLFAALPPITENDSVREVVLGDGRIMVRLSDSAYAPLSNRYRDFERIAGESQGWSVSTLSLEHPRPGTERGPDLVGYAALHVKGVPRGAAGGLGPMFVVVRQSEHEILAPVREQLGQLGLGGGIFLLALSLVGIWIADRKIIKPLRVLSKAARSIAQTARLDENAVPDERTQALAQAAVQRCRNIRTGDEISGLAGDFAAMGERVLRYHGQLEQEIAEKTEEIQRDLEMAREFQESLLPREYPRLPESDELDSIPTLGLNFHHIYKPALSVGGDFFDVFKLSDHQAGIFIADVMGHGARSALVTAILRTLLLDLSTQTTDPAELLRLINRHFYEMVQSSRQFVFVSAFCLVLDTQNRTATYANAGHPSPLLAEGATARVIPLLSHSDASANSHANSALGVAPDTKYECFSRAVAPGDTFLLYTDGVIEAPNPHGDEFGMAQLENLIAREMARQPAKPDVAALCQVVMDALNEWMHGLPSPDDICLVAVGTEGEAIRDDSDRDSPDDFLGMPYG